MLHVAPYAAKEMSVFSLAVIFVLSFNTLWTGDADLRLYITTVQDG